MRLTKTVVAKLEVPGGQAEITYYDNDLKGFGVRARRGGKRAWVAVYRIGKKVRRVTIGDTTIVGPDEARAKAREVLAKADLGEDTQAKRQEEEKTKAAVTLGAVDRALYSALCGEEAAAEDPVRDEAISPRKLAAAA